MQLKKDVYHQNNKMELIGRRRKKERKENKVKQL